MLNSSEQAFLAGPGVSQRQHKRVITTAASTWVYNIRRRAVAAPPRRVVLNDTVSANTDEKAISTASVLNCPTSSMDSFLMQP